MIERAPSPRADRRVGNVYDVDPSLAQLLLAMGFAIPEMRAEERTGDASDLFRSP